MAIAKGMSNREWLIYQRARCLHYLLDNVTSHIEKMGESLIENVLRMAEEEAEGDAEILKERELYYMKVFNTAIPDDMEQIFLQSMIVQIHSYIETILRDIAQNKNQDKSLSKIESYFNHIQNEKGKSLKPIIDYLTDWRHLCSIRNEIIHEGPVSDVLTKEYIEEKVNQAKDFLDYVEKA